jgi:hypothetical protein
MSHSVNMITPGAVPRIPRASDERSYFALPCSSLAHLLHGLP